MSDLEDTLLAVIGYAGLPSPQTQCTEPWAGTGRRFRADLCWPDRKLLCEVDGGIWSGGRHTRGAGFERDCVKTNMAVVRGWRVLRVTGSMIEDGSALAFIEEALAAEP